MDEQYRSLIRIQQILKRTHKGRSVSAKALGALDEIDKSDEASECVVCGFVAGAATTSGLCLNCGSTELKNF